MSHTGDPPRLREQLSSSSLLGRGLTAANLDGPTDEQLRDLERSLAIGLTAVAAAAPIAKAVSAASGVSWFSAATTKVVLVTLSVATVGTGAVAVSHVLVKNATPEPVAAHPAQPRARTTVVPLPDRPVESQVIAGEKPPSAAPHAVARPTRKASPALAPRPQPEDETALLDRANRALVRDPELALSLANEHRQRFAVGPLAQEREIIAIQALANLGHREDARERIAQFLRAFPQSAYRARVEQLLDRQDKE